VSYGTGINPSGRATPSRTRRHDETVKQELNALIDPLDPLKGYVTLTEGVFINDRGSLVAYGTDSRTGVSNPYFLQGTVLTLSPRSLTFGNQAVNIVSAAKSVTVTNTSAKSVAITASRWRVTTRANSPRPATAAHRSPAMQPARSR
jgi:hypothetical protein